MVLVVKLCYRIRHLGFAGRRHTVRQRHELQFNELVLVKLTLTSLRLGTSVEVEPWGKVDQSLGPAPKGGPH